MKIWKSEWRHHLQGFRKGASTVEFIVIIPLFILLGLVIWQSILFGMAIIDTQAALRDAAKVASTSGDEEKAEKQGKKSFGDNEQYKLEKIDVNIDDDIVKVEAKTTVPLLFSNAPDYQYESSSEAPLIQADNGIGGFIPPIGDGRLTIPAPSAQITSYFGEWRGTRAHLGMDFADEVDTPIIAAADGIVRTVRHMGDTSYGSFVVIDHGGGLSTLYAHMWEHQVQVSTGDKVKKGQVIGGIGNNGNSTGPHLHFEVHQNGARVDPMPYFEE